jgi:hypothetical protein
MPTYLNHGSYMKMNNFHKPSQSKPSQSDQYFQDVQTQPSEHNCLQILNHVQNCPICRHVFSPHEDVMNGIKQNGGVKSNFLGNPKNSIEISFTSLLFLISLFIVLILLIIQK